jgi:hypothetical protein
MATIRVNLDKAMEKAAQDELWAIRGRAIQSWATLEQALCNVFSMVAGLRRDIGGIIFFRIVNTPARDAILEDLLKIKFGDRFNLFWNSVLKALKEISGKRNQIVHWNAISNIGSDASGELTVEVFLRPPKSWGYDPLAPVVKTQDLKDFMAKCDFYTRACNGFYALMKAPVAGDVVIPEEHRKPWVDIFQEPLSYPPPSNHLLSPNYTGPQTLPAAFEE